MFHLDGVGGLVLSPSDLRVASGCEFALLGELDVLLGRVEAVDVAADPLLERVSALGTAHEQRELLRLSAAHPGRVRQFPIPAERTREAYEAAHRATLAALADDGVDVVYQGTFFDGGFCGFADFLVREDGRWTVCDTKLARHENVAALLQVAAYAEQLVGAGVPTTGVARLVLGSGEHDDVPLGEVLPVYRERRRRLEEVVAAHGADAGPVRWGDERWMACGRCRACEQAAEAARDVLLVAGVRMPQRARLAEAGVHTVEDLAARTAPVPGLREPVLERLRAQASLQQRQDADPAHEVIAEVTSPEALRALPTPSEGDVFFDFEGDPMWTEPGSGEWGLEYLFGMVEVDGLRPGERPRFRTFWAHDRDEERRALVDFVAYLTERRRRWPDLHVYHYADYERTALLRLAVRHGVCEEEVDQLLRDGVLVDLYATVRAGVRVSQRSYSIKKLEPLYMGADGRAADGVQQGGESIVVYHEYCSAVLDGRDVDAKARLDAITDYNEYDCVSTLRLRDWLVGRVGGDVGHGDGGHGDGVHGDGGQGGDPAGTGEAGPAARPDGAGEADRLEAALRARVGDTRRHERTRDEQALALVASSVLFHRREDKPFWWRHFARLRTPVQDWPGDDGVFVVERAEVETDWHAETPRRRPRRRLRLVGESLGGTPVGPGTEVAAVYTGEVPPGVVRDPQHLHARSPGGVTVLEADVLDGGGTGSDDGRDDRPAEVLLVEELRPKDGREHDELPVALVPGGVINTTRIDGAIGELASGVLASLPDLPRSAGVDLLRRVPPRLRSGSDLPPVGDGPDRYVDAVTAALSDLDDSYLAVQGPPGTGKTHVGSRVVARLVARGWRVGVCSQSHAAIENVLSACVRAGVPPALVGKVPRHTEDPTWTALAGSDALAGFAAGQAGGYVVGGTAWDLCHEGRVARGQLDLLVVDEAGQYSLAKTLATSVAARNLLLLGDPQQLPQVSQGSHPDPVDASALGWLVGDAAVLPPACGYFLETTWRMHPALTERVSTLAYDGRLRSHEQVTAARDLEGVAPGLHVVRVPHRDNATSSPQEAGEVLARVRDLLRRTWTAPDDPRAPRPLGRADVLVVTPYNAQVALLRATLDAAGLDDVAVGTVDRFQGQEAPVVIVSMAASAHADVSRGMRFLLDRNRLNVAVSRGQWAAYLVRSDVLTDFAPRSPRELRALGSFIALCDGGREDSPLLPPGRVGVASDV